MSLHSVPTRRPDLADHDAAAILTATAWFKDTVSLLRRGTKTVEETAEADLRVAQIQIAFGVTFGTAVASSFNPTLSPQQLVASVRFETAAVGRVRAAAFFRCFGVLDVPSDTGDDITWCQHWALRVRTLYMEQWPAISTDPAQPGLPFNARKLAFRQDRWTIPTTQRRSAVEERIAALIFNRDSLLTIGSGSS